MCSRIQVIRPWCNCAIGIAARTDPLLRRLVSPNCLCNVSKIQKCPCWQSGQDPWSILQDPVVVSSLFADRLMLGTKTLSPQEASVTEKMPAEICKHGQLWGYSNNGESPHIDRHLYLCRDGQQRKTDMLSRIYTIGWKDSLHLFTPSKIDPQPWNYIECTLGRHAEDWSVDDQFSPLSQLQ